MEIFLSYSWGESKVADTICDMFIGLNNPEIQIIRDKDRLKFMQDIKAFMKSIKDKDYVILVINDSYLKSFNCMYEISELVKDDNYKNKILVLVNKNIDIFNAKGINQYLKFWQNKCQELEEETKGLDLFNQKITIEELRKSNEINLKMSDFLQSILDLKIIQYQDNITIESFGEMKEYLGLESFKLKAIPNTYYVVNVPRTLSENNIHQGNTIVWWGYDNDSYTDDLRHARIFSLEEAEQLINDGHDWGCYKYAAIPTDLVVSFEQNVIPKSYRYMDIILKQKSRILGNNTIYLNKEDISSYI